MATRWTLCCQVPIATSPWPIHGRQHGLEAKAASRAHGRRLLHAKLKPVARGLRRELLQSGLKEGMPRQGERGGVCRRATRHPRCASAYIGAEEVVAREGGAAS